MDYGPGTLDGVFQFNTKYRKTAVCAEIDKNIGSCPHFKSYVLLRSQHHVGDVWGATTRSP
jgi:hypothetical protein